MSKQKLVVELLSALGEDPARDGLKDTPERVVRSWTEIYGGYQMDPAKVLGTTFHKDGYDEMVVLRNIEMFSTCEHHMLPFFGKAHIAYVPAERVVGLSKLARVVEVFSRRLQIQERLTKQIADAIESVLEPLGVAVVIEAKHLCMLARGVSKQNSVMATTSLTGCFRKDMACRNEFLNSIHASY